MMFMAMVAAVFLYGGVVVVILGRPAQGTAVSVPVLVKYGLIIFSILEILAVRYVAKFLFPKRPEGEKSLSLQKLIILTVVEGAACEAPALIGMILAFGGRSFYDFLPFAAIALVGFAFHVPQKRQWAEFLGVDF